MSMKSAARIPVTLAFLALWASPNAPGQIPRQPVAGTHGMVVSAERYASQAGVEILNDGGNAVDAAVAVGFALAVTYPQAGNIGGGGFMVIRFSDGKSTTLDYREKAPAGATRNMYLDESGNAVAARSREGYFSVGVPGSVAGMLLALERYGTMKREAVIAAALRYTRGFAINRVLARDLNGEAKRLAQYPGTKKLFVRSDRPFVEGDTLVQPDLEKTLGRIVERGTAGFYEGPTADAIVAEMARGGGLITKRDLESYGAVERPPVKGRYRGYDIISMGPPSSGGIMLIQLLNLLERYDLAGSGFGSSRTISLMAEAMKLAYADRAEFMGDADFSPVPTERLVSKEYADIRARLIDTLAATPSSKISHGAIPREEGTHTTHYSVADRWGNVVSVTTTINSDFGAGIVVDGAGFFLNNEMDDFSAKPGVLNQFGLLGTDANAVQPNKRMLSSMTPTILVKDGKPFMIIGSPGGATIMTTVLQVVVNVIDHGMNIQEAIDAPRIHHQWYPDKLMYEHHSLPQDVVDNLRKKGYDVVERPGYQGLAQGIVIDPRSGIFYGATDPRGSGAAIGY